MSDGDIEAAVTRLREWTNRPKLSLDGSQAAPISYPTGAIHGTPDTSAIPIWHTTSTADTTLSPWTLPSTADVIAVLDELERRDREMTLAQRLFDAQHVLSRIEDEFTDFLEAVVGDESIGNHERVTWDYYDESFELKECDIDFRWPVDGLQRIWATGFRRFWLCHKDGSETYYHDGGHPEGTRAKVAPAPFPPKEKTP